ncbi:TetR/AcrR family transcriptional regulator C-terminal domain-containing protein [Paenarthrobacter nitroguajacolicus]|uniref:TetR/AcrR family transcriptional regulator C-terminal domain-containing protein n=1 Tax=Paenarthrobacter nitroguajacolicus TaxID=211146 RepID=UPI00248CC530|nr:TetR/AcrR family transcriptional regulator C-terminal domain-containing protein [Paenarthrobacter nitroguajacolicus]MDI2033660.1 Tetracycline repressor protein class A [Paenarthrobacter nitroguajacolicus]
MGLNPDVIAKAGLSMLADVGLNGLTMRMLARELSVGASAIYGHVRDKQELLDAMATLMFVEATQDLEAPRRETTWEVWLADYMRSLRQTLLRYRDGARVFAGTYVNHPAMARTSELILRTMQDSGFGLRDAAGGVSALTHYVLSFCIEEQARAGADYSGGGPYQSGRIVEGIDMQRYPLTAQLMTESASSTPDNEFESGMQVILNGIRASHRTS